MKKTPFYVSALCLTMLVVGCKKKDPVEILYPDQQKNTSVLKEDLKSLLKSAAKKSEKFQLTAEAGGKFTTTKGNIYTVAPNIFVDKDGNPITGKVDITVNEVEDVSEMILNDKPTNAELENKKDTLNPTGAMLESLGEFKVDAKQGEKELALKPNAEIQVEVPKPKVEEPQVDKYEVPLWSGDTIEESSQKGWDYENRLVMGTERRPVQKGVEWHLTPQKAVVENVVVNNVSQPVMSFGIGKLGEWRNCDVLVPISRTTTVLGYFTNVFHEGEDGGYQGLQPNMLFFKKKGDNVLVKLYTRILNAPVGKQGFLSYQNTFNIGMEGTFLALVTKDGKFYAQKKSVTIGEPESGKNYVGISFVLNEVSEREMLDLIVSLDNE